MLINAEHLLQYQRCKRRSVLDIHGDKHQRDKPNELLVKLQQDKIAYRHSVVANLAYHKPHYPPGNWEAGREATWELMLQGVDYIYQGVLLLNYHDLMDEENQDSLLLPRYDGYTLLSRVDLLIKQPGNSCFGDWMYVVANIELGKRPKQEYRVVTAFHAQVLGKVQQVEPTTALLILRTRQREYYVDLQKWLPQMQGLLLDLIEHVESRQLPDIFISRQKCNLCHWYSHCYSIAQSEQHLSLVPGVTPIRYSQLQALSINKLESLADSNPLILENLPGFDHRVADKLIVQAKSVLKQEPLILPGVLTGQNTGDIDILLASPVELYFDIEAQPDLSLDYLLGVLVVDREANTEQFYSFLAEKPEEEGLIWQQFLDLIAQYPQAPIYHFCVYEFDTVKRLGKLYGTPKGIIVPVLNRLVDVYEKLTETVALPVESYALKAIARWLGFEWRAKDATGAKCIYWYNQWLETGDRSLLEIIQLYNEDDCRATRNVKDWLANYLKP